MVARSGPIWGASAGRVSLGSESSEMWSPPVAVGFVLKRRRRIIWGRLVWPSGAVSAAKQLAVRIGGSASGVGVGSPPEAPKSTRLKELEGVMTKDVLLDLIKRVTRVTRNQGDKPVLEELTGKAEYMGLRGTPPSRVLLVGLATG
ncbi:hypothetical protein F2Q69_00037392 [Brassica cretica]|uniref:Uncharacterized protein n=1 Tax=Brassica cretica TaxID=69181 RepID=A0A8S9SDS3_BRACR|nr:hypothetical protein F2Q69_00037392 [Brassica cretica]